ncbi:MAG: hypothetical protein MJ223_01140 [Mycoplasmoidaceae bacterium]|nr:hypothetical protein [Mycoplasmoidaceae bacterium]
MMNLIQASEARHTVRHYDGKPLTADDKNTLLAFIKELNAKSGLNMQLIVNEPKAFGGPRAAISNFTGCVNYIAVIGDKTPKFPEIAGYYGEQVVLKAQQMGLNTC